MLKTVGNPSTRYGDQTIIDGNLVIGTAGKGIDFSATPGTGTSELLDDYEEGTWSPTLHANGTDFTSVTYAAGRGGKYTKVGNVVHIQGIMVTDAVTLAGAAGTVQIGSLPFAVAADTGATDDGLVSFSVGISLFWAASRPSRALGISGTDRINLYYSLSAASDTTGLAVADVAAGAGANILTFAGTYVAA
jgi:hypothetical protein